VGRLVVVRRHRRPVVLVLLRRRPEPVRLPVLLRLPVAGLWVRRRLVVLVRVLVRRLVRFELDSIFRLA
jgi:hypothetical protein